MKDPETKETKDVTISLLRFTWFPTEADCEKLLNDFDGKDKEYTAFKEFYDGDSLAANIAYDLFHNEEAKTDPTCFRNLEGHDFFPHLGALFTGLSFFGGSFWLLVLSVLSLVFLLFDGPRHNFLFSYSMLLLGLLALIYSTMNPFLHTGTTDMPVPMLMTVFSALLIPVSIGSIVLFFVIRKQKKLAAKAAA